MTVLCGEGEGAAAARVACTRCGTRLEQRLQCTQLAVQVPYLLWIYLLWVD